jgi:hypothetical protein
MPASFEFWQRDVEAWAIFPLRPPTRRGPHLLRGFARLRPGVTLALAAAMRREIHSLDPNVPVDRVGTMEQVAAFNHLSNSATTEDAAPEGSRPPLPMFVANCR